MEIRNYDKKTGIIVGAFDLLHPGHLYAIQRAKDECEYLIVGLHVDPSVERKNKNKPIQSIFERYQQLEALRDVDEIIPYESELDLENLYKILQIDVVVLGEEYRNKAFTGKKYLQDQFVKVRWIPRDHSYSSSELRERILNSNNNELLNIYLSRPPSPLREEPISW